MFLIRWFLLPIIKPVLDNMRETELWLESECDKRINWTVVRPAGLTNSLRTDKEFKVELDQFHVSLAQLSSLFNQYDCYYPGLQRGRGGRADCQSRRGAVHVVLHRGGEISSERSCYRGLICSILYITLSQYTSQATLLYVIMKHANIYTPTSNAPGCCIFTW